MNKSEKTNKTTSCVLGMAVGAACAGGACCHQFRITLKWDHRPQTHLDAHAKQDHTRILRPGGFSSWCLSFTCITVDWFIKHRYPEPKWLFQVGGGGRGGREDKRRGHMTFQLFFLTPSSTGKTALKTHQLHILFSLHANLFKMCSCRLHVLFLFGRLVRENWKRTPGE